MVVRRLHALLAVAALAAGACGSAAADEATGEPAASAVRTDPGERPVLPVENIDSPLPAITVRDVVDHEWVQFADILPAEQPVLVWFWAPF